MADPIRTTPDREDDLLTAESAVRELHGISVFPGTAYGLCQLFGSGDLEVPQFSIEKTATRGEIQRLRAAISTVDKQLAALIRSDDEELPPEAVAFVDVHRTILGDPTLIEDTVEIIKEKLVNAEWALSIRLEKTRRDFESIEDDYIRERVKDIAQVISRVQRVLTGRRSPASLFEAEGYEEKIILVADQLDPADMLLLRGRDDLDLAGIVLEEGSTTCHAVILARSLEIPTLVGVKRARELLQNDQSVIPSNYSLPQKGDAMLDSACGNLPKTRNNSKNCVLSTQLLWTARLFTFMPILHCRRMFETSIVPALTA